MASIELSDRSDQDLPFSIEGRYRVRGHRRPDLSKLTESDIVVLEQTWQAYGHLGFNELGRLTHHHPAYRKAVEAGRQRMHYDDFLEGENAAEGVIADLKETAPRLRI